MTSLLLLSLVGIYRPYLQCEGYRPRTTIEVMQNTTPENGQPLYTFSLTKTSRGKTLKLEALSAERIPDKRKQVVEVIAVTTEKTSPDYQLMIMNPYDDDTGYKAYFMENERTRTLYCNYLVTSY